MKHRKRTPKSVPTLLVLFLAMAFCRVTVQAEPLVAPRPPVEAPAVKPWLGIITHPNLPLQPPRKEEQPQANGLTILHVVPNSPADQVGLKPKDVLLDYNQTRLRSSAQLGELLANDHPGTTIELKVERDLRTQEISVQLGTCPEQFREVQPAPRQLKPIHPSVILSPQIPAQSQSITISRSAEEKFSVEIIEIITEGEQPQTRTIEGTQEELIQQCAKLPEHLKSEIPRIVKDMPQLQNKKSSFHFHVQPRLNGEDQAVRIVMTQVNKRNEARSFQFTQIYPSQVQLKVEDLLTVEPLANELKKLPMPISQSIETTLLRYRLPRIELDVQNPQ